VDGTFDVTYTPEDLGVYDVIVKYGGQDVPGAPFPVKATPTGDASKCRITGKCASSSFFFFCFTPVDTEAYYGHHL
jgi:hypothetical protein